MDLLSSENSVELGTSPFGLAERNLAFFFGIERRLVVLLVSWLVVEEVSELILYPLNNDERDEAHGQFALCDIAIFLYSFTMTP